MFYTYIFQYQLEDLTQSQLHCSDKPSLEIALGDWPNTALNTSGKPIPHRIKDLQDSQTVVVKSVSTRFTEQELLENIKENHPSVTSVHRLHKKSSDIPFPIIKVTLNRSEATAALSDHIKIFGQNFTCETCRTVKIIRCYHCQRFGHTADCCLFAQRCTNCSGSHKQICSLPARCANCDGEHGADSNKCPTYLNIKRKLESRKMAGI